VRAPASTPKEVLARPGVEPYLTPQGYPGYISPAAGLPPYLQYTAFPGGKPSKTLRDTIEDIWRPKQAAFDKKQAAVATKAATAAKNNPMSYPQRFWMPNTLAAQIFGISVLQDLEELQTMPSEYRSAFLKQHSTLKAYLQAIAAGPKGIA
jgi:hypothetical protein